MASMNLLRALATVSGMTLLSRILGFVRDFVVARAFGAGDLGAMRRHVAAGRVPAYRIGRLLKIDLDEAEAALLRRIPTARGPR